MTDVMAYLLVFLIIIFAVITAVPVFYILFAVLETLSDWIASVYNKITKK